MSYDMLIFFKEVLGCMRVLNRDTLYLKDIEESSSSEVILNLGSKITDNLHSSVIFDKAILDGYVGGYGLSGTNTPIISKEGIDYRDSNILFTGVYLKEGDNVSLYEEIILLCDEVDIPKIKIIAGGYSKTYYGKTILNLVLKVPNTCFYGLLGESIYYDCYSEAKEYTIDDVNGKCNNMYVLTLSDILKKSNIMPPRGLYNKTLYRHFKGNWYIIEGVGEYVDRGKNLVAYRATHGDCNLYFDDVDTFVLENEKKDKYPLQDYRFMTLKELEYCLGATSEVFKEILIEYNNLINEHPFIIGL